MSLEKTYTIQFRRSSDRITTIKLRYCGGPLQGKELLRKILIQHGVCSKYRNRMLKEFEHAAKKDEGVRMMLQDIVRTAERGATEEGAKELASRLWSSEETEEKEEENVGILDSIFWTRFYEFTKHSNLRREFARVLEKYTSRARALEEKWEIRKQNLEALQAEELNLLAERDEDAISMLRNKQRLNAQWQRHWRALNRERTILIEAFQKRTRRRMFLHTNFTKGSYSKSTWSRPESCDEEEEEGEDVEEEKDEKHKDEENDKETEQVAEEEEEEENEKGEDITTPLLNKEIAFKKSPMLTFYFGPYDVSCIELGVIACPEGAMPLLRHHSKENNRSRLDAVLRVGRQIGMRAFALPLEMSIQDSRRRNNHHENEDVWTLTPELANIILRESPEMMFPRISKQFERTDGISILDSESTIRLRHDHPETVLVTQHTSIRAQILFHWIPSPDTRRDIMKQIIRRSADLGVSELLVPLPSQNVREYMRTFKAVLTELSNAQCIERPHTAIGISSQLAMPYESLGSLERIYFVQKIVSREPSSTIAIHLDPVLMSANYNHDDNANGLHRFVAYEKACASLRNVFVA